MTAGLSRLVSSRRFGLPPLRSNRPEVKSVDLPVATYAINTTAVITALNLRQLDRDWETESS